MSQEHKGNSRHSVIVPYRIGLLLDRADAAHRDLHDAMRLAIDESRATGVLDRDVILEVRESRGAPQGSVLDLIADWKAMTADRTLMGVVGPFDDDNGAALASAIEADGVPTLTYSPADDFTGRWVFQLPLGHAADVLHRLLDHLQAQGLDRFVLVREPSPRGARVEQAFRDAAWQRRLGHVEVLQRDATLATHLKRLAPQAVLYVGGWEHAQVDAALQQAGLSPLRLTGTELTHAHALLGHADALEGWTGLDLVDRQGRLFQRFATAFEKRHGRRADHVYATLGYDFGQLLALTHAFIRPPTPDGLRGGLDRVRVLPSATGKAGTVISFASWDRRGFKGDPLILSTVRGGETLPVAVAQTVVA